MLRMLLWEMVVKIEQAGMSSVSSSKPYGAFQLLG